MNINKKGNHVDKWGVMIPATGGCLMFKIVRFPKKLDPFFESLKSEFHWEHFKYFRMLVLLTGFAWGRRNITALCRHIDEKRFHHRTRFNNFVNLDRWDVGEGLKKKAYEILASLKPRKGEIITIIIDDSKKKKTGKKMEAVGWIKDPLTGRTIMGHLFVKATIKFRGHLIPFAIYLYVKKEHCADMEIEFKKTTQCAAEMIREFDAPKGVRVRVLFDSYYLCPVVVKACRKKKFRFVSVGKSNRNIYKNGRKLKVGTYGKNLFRRSKKQHLVIQKDNGPVRYTYVDAGWLEISSLGSLHVVFSRKGKNKDVRAIVTDDPKFAASSIIKAYNDRWSIEVFFKDGKQLLGLGQYQNGTHRAAVIHLHLVCFAYALLTHIAISGEGAKGKQRKSTAAYLSTGALQNELRRIVWEDTADYLKEMPDGNSVVKELSRLLVAA